MKSNYVSQYNKNNYKQYIFRVRKDDVKIIEKLDRIENKNNYFYNLINSNDHNENILTIKQIKQTIIPILNSYNIFDIYLFGSYARGEANQNSDVDIYCEKGIANNFLIQVEIENKIKEALKKRC